MRARERDPVYVLDCNPSGKSTFLNRTRGILLTTNSEKRLSALANRTGEGNKEKSLHTVKWEVGPSRVVSLEIPGCINFLSPGYACVEHSCESAFGFFANGLRDSSDCKKPGGVKYYESAGT